MVHSSPGHDHGSPPSSPLPAAPGYPALPPHHHAAAAGHLWSDHDQVHHGYHSSAAPYNYSMVDSFGWSQAQPGFSPRSMNSPVTSMSLNVSMNMTMHGVPGYEHSDQWHTSGRVTRMKLDIQELIKHTLFALLFLYLFHSSSQITRIYSVLNSTNNILFYISLFSHRIEVMMLVTEVTRLGREAGSPRPALQ